jgi:hypothetical protein
MSEVVGFEQISELQDEILGFTWQQLGDKVDKFYVQGKVSDDESGRILMAQGGFFFAVVENRVLNNADILNREELDENSDFVLPRIEELHDLLVELQGKSPVRFRWSVDTKTGQVESEWTYYDDLTDQEKEDDFWEFWEGDVAWRDQLKTELADQ